MVPETTVLIMGEDEKNPEFVNLSSKFIIGKLKKYYKIRLLEEKI